MIDISIQELLGAGVHFGHQTSRWNPKMAPFIYTARNGIHIIDLQLTVKLLQRAVDFTIELCSSGGKMLFVGTKRQAQEIIEEDAKRCGMYYITHRWLGGTLTNFRTIKKGIDYLTELKRQEEEGFPENMTKKEKLSLKRKLEKLERSLGGIKEMVRLPDALFVIDTRQEYIAVSEAIKMEIPLVGVLDTNCDPEGIAYPIPGNDDALRAVKVFSHYISEACIIGRNRYEERIKAESKEEPEAEPATMRVIKGGVTVETGVLRKRKEVSQEDVETEIKGGE